MLGKFITSFIEIPFWATHHHVNASTSNNTQNGNTWERCCASVPVQECWPGSSGGALHNWCALFHYFWPSFSSHLTSWLYDLYPVQVFAVFVARKSFKWLSNISKLNNFLCKPPALRLHTAQYAQPIHIINDYDLLALLLVLLLLILVVVMCSSKRIPIIVMHLPRHVIKPYARSTKGS